MFERQGLHFFTWRDINVAVSPWYLFLVGFIVLMPLFQGGSAMGKGVADGVLFAVALTLSLLVHEFGHALVSQRYRLAPSVLLHAFGGLCMHQPAESDKKDALILLAGPGAGLAFGALAAAVYFLVLPGLDLGGGEAALESFVWALVYINLFWSLINLLLPIWPLDGGKLFHLLLRRFKPEHEAQELALKTSIFVLVPVGIVGFFFLSFKLLVALFVIFVIMDNLNTLKSGRRLVARKAKTRASDFQQELFAEANEALEREDYEEAYRLCHQLRSTGKLPGKMLERIWEILAVTAVEMERFDEAASYLKRAPESRRVERAREVYEARSA
ncbi:MAG: site-2 protease family protein [Persicimonas sp.]